MEAQRIALSCDDDFYMSLLLSDSENLEESNHHTLSADGKYAAELQLQEVIMASFILTTLQKPHNSSVNDIIISPKKANSMMEIIGESSSSSHFLCEICAERKDSDQMFPRDQICSHRFCTECMSKHVSLKIKKTTTIVNREEEPLIACPGLDCKGTVDVNSCREILPKDVVGMWDDFLCESMILPSQRFYCPYKSCSALLVNDQEQDGAMMMIREAECPFCNRLFCARCNVPWHSGVGCEEFSRLSENERGREDLMVHQLAKKNKWRRCPNCNFFIDRNQGCLHMTCRCGFQFCYACGAAWSSTHGGCQ